MAHERKEALVADAAVAVLGYPEVSAMSYPNSGLGVLPMTLIAVIAVGTLTFWLIAVYLAARPSRPAASAAAADAPAPPASAERRIAA
jgi:hypothetical protein